MIITLEGNTTERLPVVLHNLMARNNLPYVEGDFTYLGFKISEFQEFPVSQEQIDVIKNFFAPFTLEEAKKDKLAKIAAARYEQEIAGVDVGGVVIKTDRESQALITGAALKATNDPSYTCKWKSTNGFNTLNASQIVGIADAIRDYVQSCFDKEASIYQLVENATTLEQLEQISW